MEENSEKNDNLFEYFFNHFKMRLIERYDIDITKEEYIELCKKDIDILYRLSSNKRIGFLKIKEKKVMVIRCNKEKVLNTALLEGGELPIPAAYKREGITREKFNSDLKKALEKIETLKEEMATSKNKKIFFVEKIKHYPLWMIGAANAASENKKVIISKIVFSLYNT